MVNKTTNNQSTTSSTCRKTATKVIKPSTEMKQQTKMPPVPVPVTPKSKPKPKEKKVVPPGSVTKSAKKSWQRRPKPAHSGVPVPEKLKKMLQQQVQECDCSF